MNYKVLRSEFQVVTAKPDQEDIENDEGEIGLLMINTTDGHYFEFAYHTDVNLHEGYDITPPQPRIYTYVVIAEHRHVNLQTWTQFGFTVEALDWAEAATKAQNDVWRHWDAQNPTNRGGYMRLKSIALRENQ